MEGGAIDEIEGIIGIGGGKAVLVGVEVGKLL